MRISNSFVRRLAVVALVLAGSAMMSNACSSGGGGGGGSTGGGDGGVVPPAPPIVFATPQEGAASLAAVQSMRTLLDAEFGAAISLGLNSRPAGFAAALEGAAAAGAEPVLADMIARMGETAASPTIRRAVQKSAALAAALKASRVNSVNETLAGYCSNAGGSASIRGTNNYDDVNSTTLISEYVITFTTCRDDILSTELDGTLSVELDESITTNAVRSNVTAILTEKQYTDATYAVMAAQSHIDGSFDSNDQLTSGSRSANGLFIVTVPAQGATPETINTFTYTGLNEARTLTHNADQSDTDSTVLSGTFRVDTTVGGVAVSRLELRLDVTDKTLLMNDAVGTRKNTINGVLEFRRTPEQGGCLTGSMNIITDEATPRTFSTVTGFTCPASGAVRINNALTTYGTQIQVAIDGGSSQAFADCAALAAAGGVCVQ